MRDQFVDPAVSKAKFDRQIEHFRELRGDYERKGWLLVEAEFPTAYVVMCVPNLNPPAVLCGVLVDYTNYDAVPPSVVFVQPFSREPYTWQTMPPAAKLPRAQPVEMPGLPPGLQVAAAAELVQPHAEPDGPPFLCVAGTREYHEHPGHSGDAWELHRAGGAGELVRLLDVIYRYGVEPQRGWAVHLVPQVALTIPEPAA